MAKSLYLLLACFSLFMLNGSDGKVFMNSAQEGQVFHMKNGILKDWTTKESFKANAPCTLCQYFVQKLEAYVEVHEIEAYVNKELMPVCMDLLNNTQQCQAMLKILTTELENMFETYTPSYVCKQSGFCTAGKHLSLEKLLTLGKSVQNRYGNGTLCEVCMTLTNGIDDGLKALLVELKMVIDFVCKQLPDTTSEECLNIAEEYYGALTDFLFNVLLNPDTICTEDLHLC